LYKEIAIIAPTASGKTALSISLAHKINAVILSLDSLSVYKQIDIASAKPTINERDGIIHFGIDKIFPNENFSVIQFVEEYNIAKQYAIENNKNLIIVGGTSFYLKVMIEGLSQIPKISSSTNKIVKEKLLNLEKSYNYLKNIDANYIKKININDKYRIQKALEIYVETKLTPSQFFEQNKPIPIIENLKIFKIDTGIDTLRERIKQRTSLMIQNGIIDEVISLEKKYTRKPNCMGSIGILETLDYLDGKINKAQLQEQISTHTAQLAKRQRTFNKSQFINNYSENLKNIEKKILSPEHKQSSKKKNRDSDAAEDYKTTAVQTSEKTTAPNFQRFKEMLADAESEEEENLALQIAVSERLRQLREEGGKSETIKFVEKILSLLREGKREDVKPLLGLQ